MRAHALFVAVVLPALAATTARATDDCGPDPAAALAGLAFPPNNTTAAPTNTTPIVGNVGALELTLLDGNGSTIPATLENIASGEGFGVQTRLKRLVPTTPFLPGSSISVVADGSVITQFGVGTDALATSPAAPTATLGGGGPSGACPPSTTLAVGVSSGDAVLLIADVNGVPTLGGDVTLAGIAAAASGNLTVFGEGSATVNVAGVDLAGHVGASTPVKVTFPTSPLEGCSSTGGMPWCFVIVGAGLWGWRSTRLARRTARFARD